MLGCLCLPPGFRLSPLLLLLMWPQLLLLRSGFTPSRPLRPFGQMCVYFRRRKIIRRARRDRKAQRAEAKQAQQAQQAQFMAAGEDGKPAKAAPEAGSTGLQGRLEQWWQEFTGGVQGRLCWLLRVDACC